MTRVPTPQPPPSIWRWPTRASPPCSSRHSTRCDQLAAADESAWFRGKLAHVRIAGLKAALVRDPHLPAVPAIPPRADHSAIRGRDNRRSPGRAQIDAAVEADEPQDRVNARAKGRRDPPRHWPHPARRLRGAAVGIKPARAAANGPVNQLQIGAASPVDCCVEQGTALAFAGRGAAVGQDEVEAVVGSERASDVDAARHQAEIFGGNLRRDAASAQRPVQAAAGPPAKPQRSRIDRDVFAKQPQAIAVPGDDQLQFEAGAQRDPLQKVPLGALRLAEQHGHFRPCCNPGGKGARDQRVRRRRVVGRDAGASEQLVERVAVLKLDEQLRARAVLRAFWRSGRRPLLLR